MTDRELVARIARSAGGKAGYKQLVRELGLGGGRERRLLLEQLARLTAARPAHASSIASTGAFRRLPRSTARLATISSPAGSICIAMATALCARIQNRRSGDASRLAETEDIFIPPNEINGAMQGDQVLVEVDPPKADGRRPGRIVRVLERRNSTVVGTFHYADRSADRGRQSAMSSCPSTSA